jgi:hypothetical protein
VDAMPAPVPRPSGRISAIASIQNLWLFLSGAELTRFDLMASTPINAELKREAESFRTHWISEINKQLEAYRSSAPPQISAWEGYEACREIIQADDLWCVFPDPEMEEFPLPFLMQKLSREVYFYKSFVERITPTNLAYKDAIDALSAAISKLRKAAAQRSVKEGRLQGDLNLCCSKLEKTLTRLTTQRESYWQNALIGTDEEKKNWDLHWHKDNVGTRVPPAELLKAEERFNQAQYPKQLLKRIDLDRRFQVRVATILRSYLFREDRISLRTIARLTVLTYISGDLGRQEEDSVILEKRKRPITVSSVDQIIRTAGLK